MEKTFTEAQVEALVKDTINATVMGFREWLKNETDIVDKTTREVLENTEIDVRKDTKSLMIYIYPKLKEHGINFTD